jgi:EAL domain-containing protein (putative c-di-GMP-specific phosphodiesterase class I)
VADVGRSEVDLAIVEAVAALARALGLELVAEGVERPEQLVRLRDLGCNVGQGYYFSRPLSADEVSDYLAGEAGPGQPVAPMTEDLPFPRSA